MHRFLTRPLHWLDESTPQAAVWKEREQFWAEGQPVRPLRQAFIQDERDRIARPRVQRAEQDHAHHVRQVVLSLSIDLP